MKKIFVLTINGTIHIFDRDNISDDLIDTLEKYGKTITKNNLDFKNEKDACEYFINQAKTKFKITLKEVPITNIIRININ